MNRLIEDSPILMLFSSSPNNAISSFEYSSFRLFLKYVEFYANISKLKGKRFPL